MLQLIYELRKNWRGRVDGWTGEIKGSTRGPRGPKNQNSEIIAVEWFGELTIQEGDLLALGLRNSICNSFKVVFISSFGVSG